MKSSLEKSESEAGGESFIFSRRRLLGLALALGIGIITIFQNCAEPVNPGSSLSSELNADIPFAYDVKLDHIAYMSCSGLGSNFDSESRAYFTLRVGSYDQGSGIRLSDDFLDEAENYSSNKQVNLLSGSTVNMDAQLRLSIRKRSNLQAVLGDTGGKIEEGLAYSNILAPLDAPLIALKLVDMQGTDRVRFFDSISGLDGRLVEGSLRFFGGWRDSRSVRADLKRDKLLALTYSEAEADDLISVRAPEKRSQESVYGSGFLFSFGLPRGLSDSGGAGPSYSSGRLSRVTGISEKNLLDGTSAGGRWECPPEYSFIIVREKDLNDDGSPCPVGGEDEFLKGSFADVYRRARHVLRAEDWWINPDYRCVVPKQFGGTCYESSVEKIEYNGGNCFEGSEPECPHTVSICFRSS